jgi:hypothetical protein
MTENFILSPVPDLSDLSASAIWSVRYRDPSGFECVLSLESASGVEVLQKAQAALVRLIESGCKPLHKPRVSSDTNSEPKAEKIMCPIHNAPMSEWKKDGRTWHSHKLEGGSWCKGGKA